MSLQLTNIPQEIISDIFTHIDDLASLAALARTSSHVSYEATRALYTTVKLLSLDQTVRFCRTITLHARTSAVGNHTQSLTFRPRALHIEHSPLPPKPHPGVKDYTPRPAASFFRLLARAIAALPHLTTLDLAWGFLYRHTHPTWTLDWAGTHKYLRTFRLDGVEDADALERFLARHRPDAEGGCAGVKRFENRSWLDLLDPSSPRGARVLKSFAPGLLPVADSFAGPASMLQSMGSCASELKKVRVWSWGYGSADEELAGIHEALAGNGETLRDELSGEKRVGCGVVDFAYVSKTLIEDVITLAGTYLPDVVHLTIEGYELGKTPIPERLPSLPLLESITIVARASRPTEQISRYPPVTYTLASFDDNEELDIPSMREGSVPQPADAPERQEAYSKAWLGCRRISTPRLEKVVWRPGPRDFHSMGP
ncbi:hypothetical protein FRC12_000337 [Ceratobasidium sp. 428]|nr:hypothetical protein FRC09_002263 [Ceratobasidium sp. 395]KAG8777514.1 hypothetical protein FRC12_000337 [Ceratobasidium sp. 428]